VRRGAFLLAALSACISIGVAGATSSAFIVGRSPVTSLAADGDQAAFTTVRISTDCDRAFVWQRSPQRVIQLGKKQRCAVGSAAGAITVSGGRALWLTSCCGKTRVWQLWTASLTRRTPRQLAQAPSDPSAPPPVVVGVAGGGLLPYAVGSTVTTLRANGKEAFTWTPAVPGRVVALAARDGHVAVAQEGSRVTVLDSAGQVVSVDLYEGEVSAVALTAKGLLVQRDTTLELRREADAHEFAISADGQLDDADGKFAAWSDAKSVHVMRLTDGSQVTTYPGTMAAFAGNRLYVAAGRTVTVRTIR
jgi:hypothetical protein